jgi:5'-nucleotidase
VKILVSNDDGVHSEGIWILGQQLSQVAEVVIVAPDREQSAVGTAVTLRKPLRVQKIHPLYPGIEAYSVEGTPSDSVIVGLGKIANEKVDLVISGINQGSNLGEDVLISGTVGAAMAAYLRGFPAMAVSCENWFLNQDNQDQLPRVNEPYLREVSRFIALLAQRIGRQNLPSSPFLNVNFPNLPLNEVKEVKITRLARKSHVNTVEQGHDGKRDYYMLIRQSVNHQENPRTDIWSINQRNISITPLHLFFNDRFPASLLEKLTSGLLDEFRNSASPVK